MKSSVFEMRSGVVARRTVLKLNVIQEADPVGYSNEALMLIFPAFGSCTSMFVGPSAVVFGGLAGNESRVYHRVHWSVSYAWPDLAAYPKFQ